LAEIVKIRNKPETLSAIGFLDEIAERVTCCHVLRNIADERRAHPVLHKLLHDFACHARAQPKENIVQPCYGNRETLRALRAPCENISLIASVASRAVRSFLPSAAGSNIRTPWVS
jgi:hypothetical protein